MYSAITNKKRLLRESRVYYNSQLLYFSEMSANSLWDKCEWSEFLRFYISQKYIADFTLIYTPLHAKIISVNYTLFYTQFTPWHTHKPGSHSLTITWPMAWQEMNHERSFMTSVPLKAACSGVRYYNRKLASFVYWLYVVEELNKLASVEDEIVNWCSTYKQGNLENEWWQLF